MSTNGKQESQSKAATSEGAVAPVSRHAEVSAGNAVRRVASGGPSGYKGRLDQATREAKATVAALAATVVVWIALGFGLAGLDVQVFHTPLWVVGGTLGTWVFAIAVCVFLEKSVFAEFDLDDITPVGQVPVQEAVRHDQEARYE